MQQAQWDVKSARFACSTCFYWPPFQYFKLSWSLQEKTYIVTINIYINCNERHLCSLFKASSVCMKTHYLFSRVWANVNINNKECTITLTDSGFICSHMWKGTISRENVHLGIHRVNVENTVLSTSCRSYHEDIHISVHTYTCIATW